MYGNDNNSKDEDQEQNLYKNKFYSDDSDNSYDEDDDDDDRRGKRKRNEKKRHSMHQSDIQSDDGNRNENRSQGSDSEERGREKRLSRRESYASNSGKGTRNEKDHDGNTQQNSRYQGNSQNSGKYQNKYNNNNNNGKYNKNDRKPNDQFKNANNYQNKQRINKPQAPIPSFASNQNPMNPTAMLPNLLGNFNMNMMPSFPSLFPRVGPPAPPTGKPPVSAAGTGAPSLTLSKVSKNIIYVFYIPPKLNNVAKLSQYFTFKYGAVSAYDKIDDTTASIKFEKEESMKKALESKEKPFKIDQIVVTSIKNPPPPKPAATNKPFHQNTNQNSSQNTHSQNNASKPFINKKPNLEQLEPQKQKFVKQENTIAQKPKLQLSFDQKKKQKQFDESKRLIQLKFADKVKVMIFIKQRETDPENPIRKEVQRCIDQIKQIKDILSKAQTPEDLQQIEEHELIANHQFDYSQKVFFERQEMNLTNLRPKLLEYGKVETLKPHLMQKAVDVGFTDFQAAEKAYFGLQGQYNIKFVYDHILNFLKNPFEQQQEQESELVYENQQDDGQNQEQNEQYYEENQQQIENENQEIQYEQNQEYQDNYAEQGQQQYEDQQNQEYQQEEYDQQNQYVEEEQPQYQDDQQQEQPEQQEQYEEQEQYQQYGEKYDDNIQQEDQNYQNDDDL